MSNKMISFAVIALLGFAAQTAEAHVGSAFVVPQQIDKGRTGYIAQNLENILPDITNVQPQDLIDTSCTVPVVTKDDSDGVAI